jgi:hypothetical protein
VYVLEGNSTEKATWTNQYDTTSTSYWGTERPNVWAFNWIEWEDAPVAQRGKDAVHTQYNGFTLNYKTQQELDDLIDTIISEYTNNN